MRIEAIATSKIEPMIGLKLMELLLRLLMEVISVELPKLAVLVASTMWCSMCNKICEKCEKLKFLNWDRVSGIF